MNDKVTYHQQVTYCGKPRCRKCRDGIGHGPYWYAYQAVNGQTTRTYIGKQLPPDIQATLEAEPSSTGGSDMPEEDATPPPNVAVLRALTFGQFRLERRTTNQQQPWQTITDATWQQRQESYVRSVLGYLICCPNRIASYTQICSALWPESDAETAILRLNTAIRSLRKILGHPSIGSSSQDSPRAIGAPLFLVDGEWLSLADQERLWIDADAFLELSSTSTLFQLFLLTPLRRVSVNCARALPFTMVISCQRNATLAGPTPTVSFFVVTGQTLCLSWPTSWLHVSPGLPPLKYLIACLPETRQMNQRYSV
jgi:hypothetical protein